MASMRPRLLDLFCGAGGAAMGYHRAGFDVTGVDIEPQPRYPFKFIQRDAMDVLDIIARGGRPRSMFEPFDAIHASPPCQAYTNGAPGRRRDNHPDLLPTVRALMWSTGKSCILENVPGADMPNAILLCGSTFGLPVIRHRLFELSWDIGLVPSLCHQSSWKRGVAHTGRYSYGHGNWGPAWRNHVVPAVWPWMTVAESGQAIPPAYTEYIGRQLLAVLQDA